MKLKSYLVIIVTLIFFSCIDKSSNLDTDKLVGVWSGLLFQTETPYDSIIVKPVKSPKEILLYKNGKSENFELQINNENITFRGNSGFRFDAIFSNNKDSLYGVITNNLWVQSLQFIKSGDKWVSKIVKPEIIDTDYNVYLEFYKDSLGILNAKIQSNKENRKLHFTIDSVLVNGNDINFDITNKRFEVSAKYHITEHNLLLTYGNTGGKRKINLTKLDLSKLEGYKPLTTSKYSYKTPDSLDSFIETASLGEVGIDKSMLKLMDVMNNGKYDHIHSIIVTKDNKVAFEEYFHGYNREYLHDIRSSFKSISSLLLGKAMSKDKSVKINTPIVNYYPEYNIIDEQKKGITIHHALTMSTGLKLENEDEMQWDNNDWVGFKLSFPMEYTPGEKYQYSSGGMNLLTGVIQHSTKKHLPLFFYEKVLRPMGIHKFQMRTSPKGRAYLPGDFYLRPIDFTKFGLLMLNNGMWNNQEIVSSDWITTSTTPHIKGSWPKNSDYGYLWRLLERNVGGKKMKTIEAWGNGGQLLIIIPEIKMTITFTGGNYNLFPEMEEKPFEILNTYILPAVQY